MVRSTRATTARRSTPLLGAAGARRPRGQRGARVGAGGGDDHPAGGARKKAIPEAEQREARAGERLVEHGSPPPRCPPFRRHPPAASEHMVTTVTVWLGTPRRSAHGLLAVDRLADDVGVAGVLGGLGDDVQEHPAGRARRARREPGRRRQRVDGSRSGSARPARRCGRRPARSSARTPASVSSGSIRNSSRHSCDHLRARDRLALASTASPRAALDEVGPARSIAVTCLISPPRDSSLAVGVCRACSSVRPSTV